MAKTRIGKGLKDLLTKKPKKLALKALNNPKLANRIKNRLLLPIKKDGTLPSGKSVKGLADSTIERRKRLATVNRTSRFYSAATSNLTFTGKFLNSFKAKIEQKGKKVEFSAFPTNDHKPYKGVKGKKIGKLITNEALGQYLIDGGRDYTVISEENQKAIAKSMKSAILKEFKLNLKRK